MAGDPYDADRTLSAPTALASRPGRIDQAVEFALPDTPARRRLLALYGEGLDVRLDDERAIIADLQGSSPAFIRELLRRAALLAAETSDGTLHIGDRELPPWTSAATAATH